MHGRAARLNRRFVGGLFSEHQSLTSTPGLDSVSLFCFVFPPFQSAHHVFMDILFCFWF